MSNSNEYSIKKIFRGASIYSFGEVLTKGSGFFLLPLYTRILTPTDYGIIGYLQVFISLLATIFIFGFHSAQMRYVFEYSTDTSKVGQFLYTINIFPIVISLIIFVPLSLIGSTNGWVLGKDSIPFFPYFVIAFITVVVSIFNQNMKSYFQTKQKYFRVASISFLMFLISTFSTVLFVVEFKIGALGVLAGKLIGVFIVSLIFAWLYTRDFVFKFSKEGLVFAMKFGTPVAFHLLLGMIHSSIDRIMLGHYVNLYEVGIYSLGISLSGALLIFVSAFNQAYQPSYYQLMSSDDNDIENKLINTFKIWLIAVTIGTSVLLIFGKPFLSIFIGPKFEEVSSLFPFLVLSVYFGSYYYLFSLTIFYFKKTKLLPVITGTSAIINIILNILFIPYYGIFGAAVATIISHFWVSLISYIVSRKIFKVQLPIYYIIASNIVIGFTCLLVM